jgi:YidC/Oxa1 family membrane protein insertase
MNSIFEFFQNLFSPVVAVLGWVLLFFHQNLGLSWWVSIVLLTIVVRTVLFPLTIKQVKNMRAMQDLKPDMDRIRAQFRDNRQRQQEEMMKLYQERKVNPIGGCLPLLVQMPIIIGIFYVIRHFGGAFGTEPEYPSFATGGILWFRDLSAADPYYLLPILSAVTMFAASLITVKNMDPQQRILMLSLPPVITIFMINFPAGLFVYWITSNLVTLVQNYLIYNHGPGKKTPADETTDQVSATNNGSNGTSSDTDGDHTPEDPARRAAKAAKRRRRKKKK